MAIGIIVADPNAAGTFVAGTGAFGPNDVDLPGRGLLITHDDGLTWTHVPGPFGVPAGNGSFVNYFFSDATAHIPSIAINRAKPPVMLVSADFNYHYSGLSGIYRSTDYGSTWRHVLTAPHTTDVVFDPGNSNIAYAAVGAFGDASQPAGVYRSDDAGLTWHADNGSAKLSLTLAHPGLVRLAIAASSPSTLYAVVATQSGDRNPGTFKTTDGGANWSRLSAAPFSDATGDIEPYFIAVDPANANVVYEGYGGLFRSTNGGTTWQDLSTDGHGDFIDVTHPDMRALAFSPDGSLFLGNDGGAWRTGDPQSLPIPWTSLNATLSISQIYPGMSIHPIDKTRAFAGVQDNGLLRASGAPPALSWTSIACGDGGRSLFDPSNDRRVYATCLEHGPVQRSDASGAAGSFLTAMSGIDTSELRSWIAPLAIDPADSRRLYYGAQRVYQTTNGADSWTAISPHLIDLDPADYTSRFTAIAVAPSRANVVYAGADSGTLLATTDALSGTAAHWHAAETGLPHRFLTQLAVDPGDANIVYATFSGLSGFGGDSSGHVFRSADGGGHWRDLSRGLPNAAANDVLIDPDRPATVYLATDEGVFVSGARGDGWVRLGDGLPHAVVTSLALQRPSRTLRAGTFGRGVWDLFVPLKERNHAVIRVK